jgi:3-oxoacyl-[acyl-carrier-protein] synthase II
VSIAITGVGLITPAGLTARENAERIRSGVNMQPDRSNKSLNCESFARAGQFDLERRLRYPKNIKFMSRAVQLAMYAALDALDASGVSMDSVDRARFGVHTACGETGLENEEFFGAYSLAWQDREPDFKYLSLRASKMVDPYFSLRTLTNAGSGLIAMELGLHGTSCHFIHGETSGAQALEAACEDLADRRCDVALCGAYDHLGTAAAYVAYAASGFARPRGELLLGEGAAFLVLERTEDAHSRAACIQAEVLSVDVRAGGSAAPPDVTGFSVDRGAYRPSTGYLGAATALAELAAGLELAPRAALATFRSEGWCGSAAAITVRLTD